MAKSRLEVIFDPTSQTAEFSKHFLLLKFAVELFEIPNPFGMDLICFKGEPPAHI